MKYTDWITDEGLQRVKCIARDCGTDKAIADAMHISETTLNDWKKRFPKFSECLKKGKDDYDNEVESAIHTSATTGWHYTETTYKFQYNEEKSDYDKIPIKAVEKFIPPDTTAQIFWVKCRRPEKWNDKQNNNADGTIDNRIELIIN